MSSSPLGLGIKNLIGFRVRACRVQGLGLLGFSVDTAEGLGLVRFRQDSGLPGFKP